MPQFAYKAKKEDGSVVAGSMQAESERNALDSLGRQGVFPLEIVRQGDQGRPRGRDRRRRPVRRADVGVLTQQLADLLKAGVPLHRALTTLSAQSSNGELADVVDAVAGDVAAGRALHEALSRFPKLFDRLTVNMVKAGETGGFLEEALGRLSGFIEKEQELRSRLWTALAYPILLIVLGAAAVGFLMVFFIPRFSEIFKSLGAGLPWPTQVTMAVSAFFRDYWMAPLGLAVLAPAAWVRLRDTPAGRRAIDRFRLRVPVLGEIVRKGAIARFTRSLGTLLRSGVPILDALAISREALGNVVLMQDIDEAGAGVKQGRSLAEILRRSQTFPASVVDMIAVGEESGNLDDVLINVAGATDAQVDRAMKVFVALFEPVLLVFMAGIVGFVVVSMLLPVFTLSAMIGR